MVNTRRVRTQLRVMMDIPHKTVRIQNVLQMNIQLHWIKTVERAMLMRQ